MKCATYEAYQLFHEGCLELSRIESNGMRIDVDYLDKAIKQTKKRIKETEEQLKEHKVFKVWKKVYGSNANLRSDEQFSTILFDKMGYEYPSEERTPSGRYKMDEKILELLDIPFIKIFQLWKKLKKVLVTSLEGIQKELVGEYIHPVQNLHIARTYRSSQDSPNGQNFPVRDPMLGELVRTAFIPRKNHVFVDIDYSTLEVKIGYCYHKDKNMFKYLTEKNKDGTQKNDMHRDAAERIFKVDSSLVSKEMRFFAKNQFVFAQFYGSYYVQCAPPLWLSVDRTPLVMTNGQSVREHLTNEGIKRLGTCKPDQKPRAGTFERHIQQIEEWLWGTQFKGYAQWRKDWFKKYLKTGSFVSHTGFLTEGMHSRNDVTNYPIQGSAFHCELWSLIQLNKWLRKNKMRSKIISQIHDSILADVHKNELDDYIQKAITVTTVDLLKHWKWIIVPLDIEIEIGQKNWFKKDAVDLSKYSH